MPRRRLVLAATLVVGVVATAVAGYLSLTASPSKWAPPAASRARNGNAASSAAYRASHLGEMDLRIAYGSTPQQVRRQLGAPTRTEDSCWLYSGRVGSVRGRYSGPYVDALKFCFGAGATGGTVMTRIFGHTVTHTIVRRDPLTHKIVSKQTYPAEWGNPITIIQPPAWYYQQSS